MNKDYYNRVQIYLPPETKAKFSELCRAKGQTKSEVGKFIFAEYFRMIQEQGKTSDSALTRTDLLQSQINNLRQSLAKLELKIDFALEANSVLTRTDSVNVVSKSSESVRVNPSQQEDSNSPQGELQEFRDSILEQTEPVDLNLARVALDSHSREREAKKIEEDDRNLREKSLQRAIKKAETKVQNSVSSTSKVKPFIPKDIQALNDSGGIKIPEDGNFGHEIIDKYLFPILKGRHILYGIDKQHMHYWISGGIHIKVTEDYLLAKLYHSESRMKISIPKLEEKFSLIITPISATDFLRELSRPGREQILTNWGIKYSLIKESNNG